MHGSFFQKCVFEGHMCFLSVNQGVLVFMCSHQPHPHRERRGGGGCVHLCRVVSISFGVIVHCVHVEK